MAIPEVHGYDGPGVCVLIEELSEHLECAMVSGYSEAGEGGASSR